MNKTQLTSALLLALGTSTQSHAVTFNFGNTTTDGIQGVDFNFTCNTSNFTAGAEFRFCDPNGNLGGGLLKQKSTMNGNEQWLFSGSTTGLMTGVTNTANSGGLSTVVAYYADLGYVHPSADRNGGPGIDQGAEFFGYTWGFLAPVVGSEATTSGSPHPNDTAWGAAQYTATSATTFEIFFPVLEAQWAGTHFGHGFASGGMIFYGTTDGTNFSMWTEELVDASEDFGSAGWAGWTLQLYYTGTIEGHTYIPLPASVWLFGSGLIALFSRYRRKRTPVIEA